MPVWVFHNISSLKLKIDKQLSINWRDGEAFHCNIIRNIQIYIMKIPSSSSIVALLIFLDAHIHVRVFMGVKLFMAIKFINFSKIDGEKVGSWGVLCLCFHVDGLHFKKCGDHLMDAGKSWKRNRKHFTTFLF